jgi:hypothetical protein
MKTRKKFEQVIICKSNIANSKGYVYANKDNLINGINETLFYNDLSKGSGNELASKFNALYSSAALAVNNFAIVKKHQGVYSFNDYKTFQKSEFERKFPTGLKGTPPNLDFALENDDAVIAFESKYLELLDAKIAQFKDAYCEDNLKYLNKFWFDLIARYRGKKSHLDVAQLIKHSIGLINYNSSEPKKKIILVYIYWTPKNIDQLQLEEYTKHSEELLKFSNELKKQKDIEFISLSYSQFWDKYYNDKQFNDHFNKVKERYDIEI